MKNIYILLLLCGIPCIAHAADTMCVKPTTTVVTLDPEINGTALSSNVTTGSWSTEFSYGIISGVAGCLSSASYAGTIPVDQSSVIISYSAPNTSRGCYCKMLKPIESKWVAVTNNANGQNTKCPALCASNIATTASVRRGLFGSITLP